MKSLRSYKRLKDIIEIFKHLPEPHSEQLLQSLASQDPELVRQVRESLVSFDDLLKLSPKNLLFIFRAIPIETWAIALRGIPECEKTLGAALPQRTWQDFLATQQERGPQPKSRVQEARTEILEKVRELEKQGKVSLEELRRTAQEPITR